MFTLPFCEFRYEFALTLQQLQVQRSRQSSEPAALHFLCSHDVGAGLKDGGQSYSAAIPRPLSGQHNLQNLQMRRVGRESKGVKKKKKSDEKRYKNKICDHPKGEEKLLTCRAQ